MRNNGYIDVVAKIWLGVQSEIDVASSKCLSLLVPLLLFWLIAYYQIAVVAIVLDVLISNIH